MKFTIQNIHFSWNRPPLVAQASKEENPRDWIGLGIALREFILLAYGLLESILPGPQ